MKVNRPKRINDAIRQNFWTYVRFRRGGDRTFCPWLCSQFNRGVEKTMISFMLLENGVEPGNPREPRLLKVAVEGKRQLNWQIKQWAEGVADGLFFVGDFREELPWLPDWVWDAVEHQARAMKKHTKCL